MTPRLSIILPALGGLETVRPALDVWDALDLRHELELVVLCPDADAPVPGRHLVDSTGLLLHEARAQGIRAATAEFVFLAEDHCVPDEGWAHAILRRLDEGWDGVACGLRSGNGTTLRGQAAFLLGYGEWMLPVESGPARVLPGHNVALRRQPLLDLGDELVELLVVAAFLVRRLGSSLRLTMESSATMRHFDAIEVVTQLRIFGAVGTSFGAMRTRRWPLAARALSPLAVPIVAAAHWRRAVVQFRRAGRANGLRPACLLPAAFLAVAWGCGEAVGALLGLERIASHASVSEVKPILLADLEASRTHSLPAQRHR